MKIHKLYRNLHGEHSSVGYFKTLKEAEECRNNHKGISIKTIEVGELNGKKFRMMFAGAVGMKTGNVRDVLNWNQWSADPIEECHQTFPSIVEIHRVCFTYFENLSVMVKSSVSMDHAIKQALLVRARILEDKTLDTVVPSPYGGFYWFVARDGKKTLAVVAPGQVAPGDRWSAQVICPSVSYGASFPRDCPPNPEILAAGPLDSPEVLQALEEQGWNKVCY